MNRENIDFIVLVNGEEQYSIWREDLEIPPGWKNVGVSGKKEECMAYVDKVWTDMRPLSLRQTLQKN